MFESFVYLLIIDTLAIAYVKKVMPLKFIYLSIYLFIKSWAIPRSAVMVRFSIFQAKFLKSNEDKSNDDGIYEKKISFIQLVEVKT